MLDPVQISADQARAAWAAVDAAKEMIYVTWVAIAVNAAIVLAAFIVPSIDAARRRNESARQGKQINIATANLCADALKALDLNLIDMLAAIYGGHRKVFDPFDWQREVAVYQRALNLQIQRGIDDTQLLVYVAETLLLIDKSVDAVVTLSKLEVSKIPYDSKSDEIAAYSTAAASLDSLTGRRMEVQNKLRFLLLSWGQPWKD